MELKNTLEYKSEYEKLNKAQKEAVDTIDGPVMVVAGPGTGKTQILALRIGKIFLETDTEPDGILSLTFTNAGVNAMKERMRKYIGPTGNRVNIFTFHSFGMKVIEEYYTVLGLDTAPKLLDDTDAIALFDQILHENEWEYIRPRADTSRYFRDLKSLISLLKRERLTSQDFLKEVEGEIGSLEKSPESISTRGESKGELKKEVVKTIEGLSRTREVVKFFELYENLKKEKNVFDYDDVLENLVKIVEESDEVRDEIREKYLYVLIDEHQDSSGVQNKFLQKVWGDVEKPNIFVVGDDRQLIYGFGGASLEYFEGFKHSFGKAKLITLVENYRSTQVILDVAHTLLESSITKEKLKSQNNGNDAHPMRLVEADYERDEIMACALDIKEKVKNKLDINNCAILVPKNKHVRSAVRILRDMGLPVSSYGTLRLFDSSEAHSFLRILKIINNPYDNVAFTEAIFDPLSLIPPLVAHKFIKENNMRDFSLPDLAKKKKPTLFKDEGEVSVFIEKLLSWIEKSRNLDPHALIQLVGDEFLLDSAKDHNTLITRVEVMRTVIHLMLAQIEKNPKITLQEFIAFIDRLEMYDEDIKLAVFGAEEGIKVLTLHSSKGLEFDYVWIAHMDEKSLTSSKKSGFTLPGRIKEIAEEKDEEVNKRQLYVAITRARKFCTISHAQHSYTGASLELAHIVADLPSEIFEKQSAVETEKIILQHDPRAYTEKVAEQENKFDIKDLTKLVAKEYEDRKVSVSLLNNFFECPWKWYFRNLLQLPEPKAESLEFGNAVHSSIDKILKMDHAPSAKDLEGLGVDKDVLKVVTRWVKDRLPQIRLERENEKSVSMKDERFPHLNIYGKIDLVENLSKTDLRVTDFKTGSVRKKSDIEKIDEEGRMSGYLRQLAMYSYLLQNSSKNKLDVRESRLEFLEAKDPKESIYDRVIKPEEIELLVKDIADYDHLVKNGEWTTRPCNYNSYGKNTECEYCKRAEIYK
jgi:DNA helicase-2/ATP-dependent DNA helicase PcrA